PYRVASELASTLLAQTNERVLRARVELVAGDALAGAGNAKEAREHLSAALTLGSNDKCAAGALASLGVLDLNEGRMAEARANLEAALSAAQAPRDRATERPALNMPGRLPPAQGQPGPATAQLQ